LKFLKLIYKQYTTTFFREIIIMLLAGYLVFTLAVVISPISNMLSTINDFKTGMTHETMFFSMYDRVGRIMNGGIGNPEVERIEMENHLNQMLFNIDGVIGVGRTGEFELTIASNRIRCIVYDDDMIRFTRLKLAKGTWFTETSITQGLTQVIAGGPIKNELSIGQQLNFQIDGEYIGSLNCEIIGLLGESDMYVTIGSGATEPRLPSIVSANASMKPSETSVLIIPLSQLDFVFNRNNLSMSALLFLDNSVSASALAERLEAKNEYGHFHTIDRIADNELEWNLNFYHTELVLSVSLFLFGVIGLGGYMLLSVTRNEFMMGIYYLSGMTKKKYVLLALTSTSILILAPSVFMMFFSQIMNVNSRIVNIYTNIAISLVVLLMLLFANLISMRRVIGFSITKLLGAGE